MGSQTKPAEAGRKRKPRELLNTHLDSLGERVDGELLAAAIAMQRRWHEDVLTKSPYQVREEAKKYWRDRDDCAADLPIMWVLRGTMRNIIRLDARSNMRRNAPTLPLLPWSDPHAPRHLEPDQRPLPTRLLDPYQDTLTGQKIGRIIIGNLDEPPRKFAGQLRRTFGDNEVDKFHKRCRLYGPEIRAAIGSRASPDLPPASVNPEGQGPDRYEVETSGMWMAGARRAKRSLAGARSSKRIPSKSSGEGLAKVHRRGERVRIMTPKQLKNLYTLIGLAPKRRTARQSKPARTRRIRPSNRRS